MWVSVGKHPHPLTEFHITPGKVDFDTMPGTKTMEPQDSGDERQHRFRRWLNRKQGPVNTDASISTAVSSTVPNVAGTANVNQMKSIAMEDDTGVSITASNPVTTTPATTTLNQRSPATKVGNVGDWTTVSISLPTTLVPANVNQTKTVTKEENTIDSTTASTSVATKANTTKPIAKEDNITDLTTMNKPKAPVPKQILPLQQAIKRLNTSIEGLYKIKGVLHNELNNIKIDPNWWEKPVNAPSLDIDAMDSQLDEVSKLTDRLLFDRREAAEPQEPRQGILPATMNFLKTAGHALSPATKVVLMAASQVSCSVQPSSDEINQ